MRKESFKTMLEESRKLNIARIGVNLVRSVYSNEVRLRSWARILVQVTIYRRLLIGRD